MPQDDTTPVPPHDDFTTVGEAARRIVEAARKLREKQKTPEPVDA